MTAGDTWTLAIETIPVTDYGIRFWLKCGVTHVRYTCIGADKMGRLKYRIEALNPLTSCVYPLWRHYTRYPGNPPQDIGHVAIELTADDRCALMTFGEWNAVAWDKRQNDLSHEQRTSQRWG